MKLKGIFQGHFGMNYKFIICVEIKELTKEEFLQLWYDLDLEPTFSSDLKSEEST